MLKSEDYSLLEKARGKDDAKKFLSGFGYDGADIAQMLKNKRNEVWETCLELCNEEMSKFLVLNDFHNIKAVLKAAMSGNMWENIVYYPTNIDCKKLYDEAQRGKFSEEICQKAYQIYKKAGARAFEIYLDRKELDTLSRNTNGTAHRYAELLKLYSNLNAYLREDKKEILQEALCECELIDKDVLIGGVGDKSAALVKEDYKDVLEGFYKSSEFLDIWLEEQTDRLLSTEEYDFFSFAPVLAYFLKGMREIKNIRIALTKGGIGYV